jgi:hypothetical protein
MERAPQGHFWSIDECRWIAYQRVTEIPVPRPADAEADPPEAVARLEAPASLEVR